MWADSRTKSRLQSSLLSVVRGRRHRPRAVPGGVRATSRHEAAGRGDRRADGGAVRRSREPTPARQVSAAPTAIEDDRDHEPSKSAVHYDPYDVDIDDDPYPTWTPAPGRGPAVPQRRARLLGAEPVGRRETRAARLGDVSLRTGDGSRDRQGRCRDPTRDPALRGSADPRRAPSAALAGVHAAAHARPRTARAQLLRPARSTRSLGRDEFDIIGEFGVEIPLRTIGFLFGIPEADQDVYRKTTDRRDHHRRHTGRLRSVVVRRRPVRARRLRRVASHATRPTTS